MVSQIALHRFDIIAGADRCHGVAVSKIMQTGIRQADGCSNAFEVVIDSMWREVLSRIIAKYIATILPERPRRQTRPILLYSVLTQELYHKVGSGDRSTLAILCGNKMELSRLSWDVLELLINADRSLVQIHTVPFQPTGFAAAHTGEKDRQIDRLKAVSLYRRHKCTDGLAVQRFNLLALNPWQLASIRWIKAEIPHLYCLLQSLVQYTMDVLDRLGRQTGSVPLRFRQIVIEVLNSRRLQCLQLDRTKGGFQVVLDVLGIVEHCERLYAAEVGFRPCVQPLPPQ